MLILNKSSNIIMHPKANSNINTIANAIVYYYPKNKINNLRPGIAHRIDKDTSGLIILTKNNKINNLLSFEFQKRNIVKKYLSFVFGVFFKKKLNLITKHTKYAAKKK